MPLWPPETPRCSVCRTHFGLPKRSFPSRATAQQLCARQKDPGLVVYACPAGAGWHLGHPSITPQRRESHRVDAHVEPKLPTKLHKEPSMKMQATLANPFLIALYSAALLLIGCGVGRRWAHTPATASGCVLPEARSWPPMTLPQVFCGSS
ncbi:MAG: hypothetical protein WCD70_03555 [Alphaproteobacteria bacterium]